MNQQEQSIVTPTTDPAVLRTSLAAYLEELRESGVEGLPAEASYDAPQGLAHVTDSRKVQQDQDPAEISAEGTTRHETLEHVRKNLGDCKRCKLGTTRKNLVFGTGNPKARLVFVGEGPGADEDEKGEPFVGAAGQVLNRLIMNMGLKREEVYICNVVKCRPPGNRDPEPDEVTACSPFLLRQLKSINPEVIVALGKPAAQTLLGTKEAISRLRGKFRDFHGTPLMPTYHPSFLLRKQREGSNDAFWEVWDDMTQVLQLLKLPVPEKNRKT
jgi:uracil-DNA glycosylase